MEAPSPCPLPWQLSIKPTSARMTAIEIVVDTRGNPVVAEARHVDFAGFDIRRDDDSSRTCPQPGSLQGSRDRQQECEGPPVTTPSVSRMFLPSSQSVVSRWVRTSTLGCHRTAYRSAATCVWAPR